MTLVGNGRATDELVNHRDFTQTEILEDFYASLEPSLEEKSDEGAIYMGMFTKLANWSNH